GLSHVRALDDDAVSVRQVLLERGGPAAAEAGPQTGDGGGVSNAGLVLDLNRAHRREQLFDEVVLLVVQYRPTETGDPHRAVEPVAVFVVVLPRLTAGLQHPVGNHVHRRVEIEFFPLGAVRPAIAHSLVPQLTGDEVLTGRALGAQSAAGNRTVRVPFDLDDFLVLDEN